MKKRKASNRRGESLVPEVTMSKPQKSKEKGKKRGDRRKRENS